MASMVCVSGVVRIRSGSVRIDDGIRFEIGFFLGVFLIAALFISVIVAVVWVVRVVWRRRFCLLISAKNLFGLRVH